MQRNNSRRTLKINLNRKQASEEREKYLPVHMDSESNVALVFLLEFLSGLKEKLLE